MPTAHDHAPININLRSLSQLFNSLDPSPFHDRDLDPDASRFLVEEAEDRARREDLTIRIHMPAGEAGQATFVPTAIRSHFARLGQNEERNLRRTLREGRRALGIGLIFVVLFLAGLEIVRSVLPADGWARGVHESLTILAWVVLWRPVELLLYDWWPIARRVRLYARLANATIECVPLGAHSIV